MSKYTTEVRFICESLNGFYVSEGYTNISKIIETARTQIFDFAYPIYDENYRATLETKILKHFYTREIGFESYGLWKLKLDAKMNEIMPYFNKLYESELISFNPLYTADLKKSRTTDYTGDTTSTSKQTGEAQSDTSTTGTATETGDNTTTTNSNVTQSGSNRYSDTPQGTLSNIEDNTYLTNATLTSETQGQTGTGTEKTTTNTTSSSNEASNTSTTSNTDNTSNTKSKEDYLETIVGYQGQSPSKSLADYRKTFLNIDMQVIESLEPLFMQLW